MRTAVPGRSAGEPFVASLLPSSVGGPRTVSGGCDQLRVVARSRGGSPAAGRIGRRDDPPVEGRTDGGVDGVT